MTVSQISDLVMEAPNGSRHNTKSRKGCSECKRKRVKCDETKPACVRCQKARSADLCDYNLKLSWTQGRPFKKRKLDGTVGSPEVLSTEFVFTADDRRNSHNASRGGSPLQDARIVPPVPSVTDMVMFQGSNPALESQAYDRR